MSYWLVVGPPDNWAFCFKNGNVWGFSPTYQKAWESLCDGDILLCYATRPVVGLIGYCAVRLKQKVERPFFPQETKEKHVLWPLRVTLAPKKIIPEGTWTNRRVSLERKGVTLQRALQRLPEQRAKGTIRELDKA